MCYLVLVKSSDTLFNYCSPELLKIQKENYKSGPAVQTMTQGYSHFHKLPNVMMKINSFNDNIMHCFIKSDI